MKAINYASFKVKQKATRTVKHKINFIILQEINLP